MFRQSLLAGVASIAFAYGGVAYSQTVNSTGTGTATSGSNSTSGSASQSNSTGNVGNVSNNNPVANATGTGTANSNANSLSGSSSRSQGGAGGNARNTATNSAGASTGSSGATVNQNSTNSLPGQRGSGTTDPGGQPYGTWNGGDVTVRSAPTVYAPPVSGGNPCTLAVSGGVSMIGWGASAGGTFVDQDCANRQKIAMIWNAGYKGPAKELMCNDKDTYVAFRTSGEPCALRPDWEPKGAQPMPMQQPMPQPIAPQVMSPVPPVTMTTKTQSNLPRCNPRAGIVDNCYSG